MVCELTGSCYHVPKLVLFLVPMERLDRNPFQPLENHSKARGTGSNSQQQDGLVNRGQGADVWDPRDIFIHSVGPWICQVLVGWYEGNPLLVELGKYKLMNSTHFWWLSMSRTASTAVVIILECENTYHRSVLSVSLELDRDSSSLWEANIRMETTHFQEWNGCFQK